MTQPHSPSGPTSPPVQPPALRPSSLFLVGMMGAGKSTIGRHLARQAGLAFIDVDRELELRAGVSIATIFAVEGEPAFRQRETQLLDELTQRPGVVLATGGGAVLAAENRAMLRERGLVLYLDASADEIHRRTRGDTARPLLQGDDPQARIAALLATRDPLYREVAHRVFRSPAGNPRRLVARVLADPQVAAVAEAGRAARAPAV
jgi:shikimate kinase